MLNYIWSIMILISIITAVFTGRVSEVAQAAFEEANNAVSVVLGFMGVTAMWNGIMKIAEEGGLIKTFTAFIKPINKIIFPQLRSESRAMEAVSANMVANILGLSNAATPLGIKAMQELDRINGRGNTASDAMCMLAVINSASIQLIPSTLIGIRASMGSAAPTEIIFPVWIVSTMVAFLCIFACKTFSGITSKNKMGVRKWENT